jgi:putative transposase
MDKSSYQVRANEWASIIQDQLSSNMSKSAWCRENGVNLRQFFYWQRRLRNHLIDSASKQPLTPSVSFCELSLPNETSGVHTTNVTQPSIPSSDLIIELNGCRVLIGDSVSKKALQSVIEVLRYV